MAAVVFFGSPDFALPSLRVLLPTEYKPVLVVTQPDRPAGRGKKLKPTPVRRMAEENGIAVRVVENFGEGDIIDYLRSFKPDFFVVVAFGLIFPSRALKVAVKGNINVHASLLPAYRGAGPVSRAIINGDAFTGVSTMEIVKSLDAGPIYLQRVLPIDPMENSGELSDRLSIEGASLLVETLRAIDSTGLKPVDQPEEGVSRAPRLRKKDGLIPWEKDALSVHNHIRGMTPWPGSFTYYGASYIKIHRAEPYDLVQKNGPPGLIMESGSTGVLVECGKGAVRLKRLQCEGKRPLDVDEFLRGFPLRVGEVLGGGGRE